MTAAIFDIDGTLVDSVDLHAHAWQEAFHHFGHEFSFERVRSQIGKGGDQLLPELLGEEEFKKRGKEISEWRGDLFRRDYLAKVKAFPNVRALFQRLLADGWKLALASSAKKRELEVYKEIAQVTDLLEAETSADDAEKSKPHPDIFQAALQRLGSVAPEECVVVGDSPYDAQAASKAGIRSIGFLCGGFPRQDLEPAGYEAIYQDATDVLEHYTESIFHRERPNR